LTGFGQERQSRTVSDFDETYQDDGKCSFLAKDSALPRTIGPHSFRNFCSSQAAAEPLLVTASLLGLFARFVGDLRGIASRQAEKMFA
jgi:hypothetical protein